MTNLHDIYQYQRGSEEGFEKGIDAMASAMLQTSFARSNPLTFAKVVIETAEQLKEQGAENGR